MTKKERIAKATAEVAEEMQVFDVPTLLAVANGEVDVKTLAKQQLAAMGLGFNGRWVGFDAAKLLWQVKEN